MFQESGLLNLIGCDQLVWSKIGVGYYPVQDQPYDQEYWSRYRLMDATEMGSALTQARIAMVRRHWQGELIDVGIGGGRFVADCSGAFGYDINPHAIEWLFTKHKYKTPYAGKVKCASMWDSIEHIDRFDELLNNVTDYVFMSTPIYEDANHVLRSKHFRKDEHFWYFTADGLIEVMKFLGFALIEANRIEETIGREDIGSFTFKRFKNAPN